MCLLHFKKILDMNNNCFACIYSWIIMGRIIKQAYTFKTGLSGCLSVKAGLAPGCMKDQPGEVSWCGWGRGREGLMKWAWRHA